MLITVLLVARTGYAQNLLPGENQSSTALSEEQVLERNWLENPIYPDIQNWEIAQDEFTFTNSELIVTPRFGGQFTTGPGVGYESSFGSIFGFYPLIQTPGENLFYVDGRLNLSTEDANLGGNLVLGYRDYVPSFDAAWGGYVGFDIRESDENQTFYQIGLGAELLGNPWEMRVNGYIPVGDTRQQFGSTVIGTTPQFQGNFLSLESTSFFESALTGFDLEGGVKLVDWGRGNLRGYIGTYFFDASEGDGFVGFRSRLLARITENFNAGVLLQTDGEFGTNVIFTVGASFGGTPPVTSEQTQEESIVARLGDFVSRQENIGIQRQVDRDFVPLTNPDTGGNWFFIHVAPGGSSDGTFEDPFGTVAEAIAVAPSDGNTIVYIQGVDSIGSFTIPDQVQVLSTGPQQFVNTDSGNVQLPLSGDGTTFPSVNGTVTVANNTVLSGLTINGVTGSNAVEGTGVSNVTIRDNQISGGDDGIRLNNVTGNVEITNNQIQNAGNDGIEINQQNGVTLTNANISSNTVTNSTADAIFITAQNGGIVTNTTIDGNQVNNAGQNAINLDSRGTNSQIQTATISNNTLNDPRLDGILVVADNGGAIDNVTINSNMVNDALRGIEIQSTSANSRIGTVTVDGNTLTNLTGNGILLLISSDGTIASGTSEVVTVTNNNITNPAENGFRFANASTGARTCTALANNTFTGIPNNNFSYDLFANGGNFEFNVASFGDLQTANPGANFNFTSIPPGSGPDNPQAPFTFGTATCQ